MANYSGSRVSEIDVSDPALNLDDSKSARKVIKVDAQNVGGDTYETIADALAAAEPGTIIQVAEGHYCESLVVKTPNLIIEPMEEDGSVIILSSKKPVFRVFLNPDERCEINRIRMIYKGPNKEATFTQKIDMNYESEGNHKCILEFYMSKDMQCIVLLLAGQLTCNRCLMSLDGVAAHITEKVP